MLTVVLDVFILASQREVVGLTLAGHAAIAYRYSCHDQLHSTCSWLLQEPSSCESLVHFDNKFLHVQGRGIRWLLVRGDVGVVQYEVVGSLNVDDRFLVIRCLSQVLQACDLKQVVQGHLVVYPQFGEGFYPWFLLAELDVAQVRVGYAGIGLHLPERLGAPELPEEFPDGRALAGLVLGPLVLGFVSAYGVLWLAGLVHMFYNNHCATILWQYSASFAIIDAADIVPTTIKRGFVRALLGQVYHMETGNEDFRLSEEDSKQVVKLDKESPLLQRAREVMIRAVIKERLAILAEIQALDLRSSEVEQPVSGLWSEMPLVAKEHEASLGDGEVGTDKPLRAEDSELGGCGGVTVC